MFTASMRTKPLEYRETSPRGRSELALTTLGIILLVAAVSAFGAELVLLTLRAPTQDQLATGMEVTVFAVVAGFLLYGSMVYLITRLGYWRRVAKHPGIDYEHLVQWAQSQTMPPLTILIPSYKEEPRIITMALLSAGLLDYPRKRVVLLLDDPPNPNTPADRRRLAEARRLTREVHDLLQTPAAWCRHALAQDRAQGSPLPSLQQRIERLADLHQQLARWFRVRAHQYDPRDRAEEFFATHVLTRRTTHHRARAAALRRYARAAGSQIRPAQIRQEYRYLVRLFTVPMSSFERKRYANLSHEANKAMNLNSYIGLLGKSWKRVGRPNGVFLTPSTPDHADFAVPDARYLITLDADSLLLPDYALRLIHFMEQPGHEHVAVVQTPYRAFPLAAGKLERIAGATTDIQSIIHQGLTAYRATYWVGANALLRTAALHDIGTVVREGPLTIMKYIQDRTVIEDTESSIDLILRQWSLYNYPAWLSYSATPPDFGSLLIQRRRWANGGLLILPKLVSYLIRKTHRRGGKFLEVFVRAHYLVSLAAVSIGLLLVILYPFKTIEQRPIVWLMGAFLVYFFFYGRDLLRFGYTLGDLPRVYALNFMLLPVHLGGVLKSLQQLLTRRKTPFGRTPKVASRTRAPALYLLAEYGLFCYSALAVVFDSLSGKWMHATFSFINSLAFAYALTTFIGWREGTDDLRARVKELTQKVATASLPLRGNKGMKISESS